MTSMTPGYASPPLKTPACQRTLPPPPKAPHLQELQHDAARRPSDVGGLAVAAERVEGGKHLQAGGWQRCACVHVC